MNSTTAVSRTAALALLSIAAACGGGSGGAADAGPVCQATFSGNFSDSISGSGACPSLAAAGNDAGATAGALTLSLASSVAGAPTQIEIDLGTASVGTFSSESVASWKALGINTSNCEFSAGNDSVPNGSFTLTLSSIGAGDLHGSLSVVQYVHAPPGTSCGAASNEQIDVVF